MMGSLRHPGRLPPSNTNAVHRVGIVGNLLRKPVLVPFLCLTLLGAHRTEALAQANAAAAETLFEQGRASLAAGNLEAACAAFRQSDSLDPAIGTKLNLADCERRRGRVATAWELFKAVEEQLGPSEPRHTVAKQSREALEPMVPKLQLRLAPGAPSSTQVQQGTASYAGAAFGIPLPMDPGRYELLVKAPGYQDVHTTVELEPGQTLALEVRPGAPLAPPGVPTSSNAGGLERHAPDAAPGPAQGAPLTRNWAAINTFGGVGVAGLVLGATSGVLALRAKSTNADHCDESTKTCDETGREAASSGRLYGTVTTLSLTASALSLGLATYFYLKPQHASPKTPTMTATLGPTSAKLDWVLVW